MTSASQIQAAAERVGSLDLLINNMVRAATITPGLIPGADHHTAGNTSFPGTATRPSGWARGWRVPAYTRFAPLLRASSTSAVNNVSMMAIAPLPLTPAYAISKAAAFNMTQSLRALLAGRGVRVHAVLTGPVDTDMTRGFDIPKASAGSVARAIFDGVERGEEEIFPDPMSQSIAGSWLSGAVKSLERQNAAFVEAELVTS